MVADLYQVAAAAGAALAVLVVMVVLVLVVMVMLGVIVVLHLLHGGRQGVDVLHNVNDLPAAELVPGRGYDRGVGV